MSDTRVGVRDGRGVVISAECGAHGITVGHYDGASFTNLRAIGEGLARADGEVTERAGV
jgi:hypothetical protein